MTVLVTDNHVTIDPLVSPANNLVINYSDSEKGKGTDRGGKERGREQGGGEKELIKRMFVMGAQ